MLITLSNTETGKRYRVAQLKGGLNFQRRIAAMGIFIGGVIEVGRKAPFKGPILVNINSSVVAIGRNIAFRIYVEEI